MYLTIKIKILLSVKPTTMTESYIETYTTIFHESPRNVLYPSIVLSRSSCFPLPPSYTLSPMYLRDVPRPPLSHIPALLAVPAKVNRHEMKPRPGRPRPCRACKDPGKDNRDRTGAARWHLVARNELLLLGGSRTTLRPEPILINQMKLHQKKN